VPVEALSLVVLGFAAEFTSGFAAAGALLQEGVLTVNQPVLALLIGNITAFPIRALRHQLPQLMGIFTPKLGFQMLMLGQGFRIASLALAGALYYVVPSGELVSTVTPRPEVLGQSSPGKLSSSSVWQPARLCRGVCPPVPAISIHQENRP
jgi:hypothetical protein